FRKQTHARDAARSRKLMEGSIADGMQKQHFRKPGEKGAELGKISQRRRVATVRFNHPLATAHGLLLGASAFGAEPASARHGLAAVDAKFRDGLAARGCGRYGGRWASRRAGPWLYRIHHALRHREPSS